MLSPLMLIPPPRFTINLPKLQVENLEHMCRHDEPARVQAAMLDTCQLMEAHIAPKHYDEPFVQAAAFLVLREYTWHRARKRGKLPRCWEHVYALIEPFHKER